jgi:hypothetical protein
MGNTLDPGSVRLITGVGASFAITKRGAKLSIDSVLAQEGSTLKVIKLSPPKINSMAGKRSIEETANGVQSTRIRLFSWWNQSANQRHVFSTITLEVLIMWPPRI